VKKITETLWLQNKFNYFNNNKNKNRHRSKNHHYDEKIQLITITDYT